ncbi:flagellar protein FlaG [Paenibacillus mendelii]|uniref:Flagellar protein FlaG n=1 Tax=Paenibacillus mendelii TaxID=206163 RepID=A0ABV6J642_9BACL|nr:flagellar protein FlaG [Paenibacillus mendelii]MCQ6563564.1 flagellar protein FlaG [Paenibacillus mendelii]
MSMNLSSVGGNRMPIADSGAGEIEKAVRVSGRDMSIINTMEAMRLAELRGVKLSVGEEQKIKMLDQAIKAVDGPNTTIQLSVHKETNTIMIKVMNKDTGEMIREVPPEKTLDVAASLMEIAGILIDQKV